jgi:Flp pilus assembly protein TadD
MTSTTAFPPAEAIDRGIDALRSQRFQDALSIFEQLRASWPDDAELLSLCGVAHLRCGQAPTAAPLLTRAVELAPREPGLRLNLAEFLDSDGQQDAARAELARILELQPAHLVARLRLANSLNAGGRFDEALRVIDDAPPQHTDHVLLRLACADSLGGQRDWRRLASFAQAWVRQRWHECGCMAAAVTRVFRDGHAPDVAGRPSRFSRTQDRQCRHLDPTRTHLYPCPGIRCG